MRRKSIKKRSLRRKSIKKRKYDGAKESDDHKSGHTEALSLTPLAKPAMTTVKLYDRIHIKDLSHSDSKKPDVLIFEEVKIDEKWRCDRKPPQGLWYAFGNQWIEYCNEIGANRWIYNNKELNPTFRLQIVIFLK